MVRSAACPSRAVWLSDGRTALSTGPVRWHITEGSSSPTRAALRAASTITSGRVVSSSSTGRATCRPPAGSTCAGWVGQDVASNWEMWTESDLDGYHLATLHASLWRVIPDTQYQAAVMAGEDRVQATTRDRGRAPRRQPSLCSLREH